MSLSGIINHSHSFTRLEIYHHIYFVNLKFLHILVVSFQFTYSNILNYTHQQVPYLFDFIVIHPNDYHFECK